MPVTMKDIAKRAGTSVMTVSRALNNKDEIGKETKDLILKIAEELNYTPNDLAKSLSTKKTKTVGIIIPGMDTFYADIVDAISHESREHGYAVFLCNSRGSASKELELLQLLRKKRVDGILIYPIQEDNRYIDELCNCPVPYVFLNRHTDSLQCDYVINNNVLGASLVVNHLIQKGFKKITYICAKPNASSGKERIAGCKKAFVKNNLSMDGLKIVTCHENIEACYQLVKNLLSDDPHLNALFVWDDRLTIGAMKAIVDAGKQIPKDVAVVGYDDLESSEFLNPPLTTVRHPSYEIGKTAVRVLIKKIESAHKPKVKKIVLKPKLIIRQTA